MGALLAGAGASGAVACGPFCSAPVALGGVLRSLWSLLWIALGGPVPQPPLVGGQSDPGSPALPQELVEGSSHPQEHSLVYRMVGNKGLR